MPTIPIILSENGVTLNEVEAYKTMYSPIDIKEDVKGVLFFSRMRSMEDFKVYTITVP